MRMTCASMLAAAPPPSTAVIILQAFVRGLQLQRLKEQIHLSIPCSLAAALDEAEQVEHILPWSEALWRQAEMKKSEEEENGGSPG